MHKYLRAIGFSDLNKKDLKKLIEGAVEKPDIYRATKDSEGNEFNEISVMTTKRTGIRICGTVDENDNFLMEYYFPFFQGETVSTQEQIEVSRRAGQEAFIGVCDDVNIGVTIIFALNSASDYLADHMMFHKQNYFGAKLTGLASEACVLLPTAKKNYDRKKEEIKRSEHNQLIAKAREGNEEAIESLTMEDMDTYSLLSMRIQKEDILSIVNTYFMPYGVETDQYSILAEIISWQEDTNLITEEKIYILQLSCNNIFLEVCVNAKDLLGQPEVGRRLKANIWLQGDLCYN